VWCGGSPVDDCEEEAAARGGGVIEVGLDPENGRGSREVWTRFGGAEGGMAQDSEAACRLAQIGGRGVSGIGDVVAEFGFVGVGCFFCFC